MYQNVNMVVDLTASPPQFPTQLHSDQQEMAKAILEYLQSLTPAFMQIGTRADVRSQLKELTRLRVNLAYSLRSDRSNEWLYTANALMDEIEKAEKPLLEYFEQNQIIEEGVQAAQLVEELQSLNKEQDIFHQRLHISNKQKNAAERAQIQTQYESLKQKIIDFEAKLIKHEAYINPNKNIEICQALNKLCENFQNDRQQWRKQQFTRLTRVQDKAQLFFSEIGSGISGKWNQLRDIVSGKNERILAKQLSRLEQEVAISKGVLDGMDSMLDLMPTYRAGMQDNIAQLRNQLLELDTSFHLLRDRRPLSPQAASKSYEKRLAGIGRTLEEMNRHVILAELSSSINAITSATSRSDAVLAIERTNTILSSLTMEAPLIRQSAQPGDMQRVTQAQTSFENAKKAAMQKFNLPAAVNSSATDAQVSLPTLNSMRRK
jgi:hypothetical protein